jgi:hypothetical protein
LKSSPPTPVRPWRGLLCLASVLALQACVVVPQTRETYDAECRTMKREMTLETAVLGTFQSCQGDACKAMLVATGAVTAATAVVSGSIAMVGNIVYWFERQGGCTRASPPAAAASAP